MNLLRKLLFPFAVLYDMITRLRNIFFDYGWFKSYSFDLPVIVVGNLSVGGTGKTPQIEYLIRLLSDKFSVATLSRGYKRKSKGFVLADKYANAEILGDEPFQFYKKFPTIQVAVDSDRRNGIEQLLLQPISPQVILLDDAFQHRRVKAGFYILLTSFNDLFLDDFVLPSGSLRESRLGAKRADAIIITKCPSGLDAKKQDQIRQRLQRALGIDKNTYFTFIDYDNTIFSKDKSISLAEVKPSDFILLAGIAKPQPFFSQFKKADTVCLTYPDHHHFTIKDIEEIKSKAGDKKIITTEKDYVRLMDSILQDQLYYVPIRTSFITDSDNFDKTILDFVENKMAMQQRLS